MAGTDRTDAAAAPPQTETASKTAGTGTGQDPRHRPARPDPDTGEVRAGPGDAGLQDRPAINRGTSGTKQMSNRRLSIGLGIALGLAVLAFIFAALF